MTIPNILNDDRVWNNVKPLKNEINYPPQITSVYGRNSCQRCKWRTAIWLLQQLIWLTGSQFSLLTGQGVHRTYGSQKAGHLSKELHSDMQKSSLQKHGESSGHLPWTAGFLFGWFATEYPGSTWQRLNSTSFRSQWDLSAWPWRFCTFRQFHSVLALHEMRHVRDFARPFLIKIW